ncbi:MAG: PEP-CTERM sorting domain-containing protein [Phycisphaeraceae bacterium]
MKTRVLLSALTLSAFGLAGAASAATPNAFANGGFETAGAGTPAQGWVPAASGYIRSSDALSGDWALQLASPAQNAAVALQNSVADGGQPDLIPGEIASFSFWSKGTAGGTGNVLYALRFLDTVGNILSDSGNVFFQADINTDDYSLITADEVLVPTGANAAFVEFSQSIGPIGTGPAGEDWFAGLVLIDDLVLQTKAPGDTDGDGDIDDTDLGTIFSSYTGPVGAAGGKTSLDGDTDLDGDVDDTDLGTAFSGYTGPLGPAAVPEPTSLALLGLGGLFLSRRRHGAA